MKACTLLFRTNAERYPGTRLHLPGIAERPCRLRSFRFLTQGITGAILILIAATTLVAEQERSVRVTPEAVQLSGQVRDPTEKAVAGAKVVVENVQTSSQYSVFTSENGRFQFTTLPAGEYRLVITAAGYKIFSIARMSLLTAGNVTANAVLEASSGSNVPQAVETSGVSNADALTGKSVRSPGENQRNFVNLVQVSGGATEGSENGAAGGSRPGAQHQSSAVSLGGQREATNNSMIDGIDNNERFNSQIALHPSVEGIGEVQVLSNAYPASFGRAGGGVINVITKSGTDRLHGTAYEYFRNDLLDAFPFQFGAQNPKSELRQNQFGGSLGGPLGRWGGYFFGDYEAFRLVQGRAPSELTVPTAFEHDHPGDFTDKGGPLLTQLDPVGLSYFKLYPKPNVPGASDLFVSGANGSNFSHIGDLRVDHRISEADQLFARFSYNRSFVFIPGEFPKQEEDGITIQPGGSLSSLPGNIDETVVNAIVNYSRAVSARLLLDAQAGYTFWGEVDTGLNPGTAVNRGFGQPGVNLPFTSNGLAPINVISAAPLGTDGLNRPLNQADSVLQYSGAVTWNSSRHNVRLGASLIQRELRDMGSSAGLGMWVINDLPSLLEGRFLQVQRQVDLINAHYQSFEPSAFVQDEWRALPNLSLSLGIRYDIFTPATEARNQLANFELSTGKVIVAGQDGVSNTAGVLTDYSGIAPRVGFSWKLPESSVLRGGYGMVSFRPIDGFLYRAEPFIYSFGVCSSLNCPDGFTTLAAGLPFSSNPSASDPAGILRGIRPFNYHNGYIHQFNIGLEQQHGNDTVRVFYVGALGRHISRGFPDINAPPPNTAVDPNPLRPFYTTAPHLTSIHYIDTEGSSSYNALQATFLHAIHNGLTAQFNYTWAHGLDNTSGNTFGDVPALASKLDYGNSDVDVRQRVAGSIFYELPFGKTDRGALGLITRSWQFNLSGVWSVGLPFTVANANNVSNTNPGAFGLDRPNQIANAALANPGVSNFFNTAAFVAQNPGTLGDERNNQLYGPHNRRLDVSLFKNFAVTREAQLQFRAEAFNVTNTANFAAPASVLGAANFGRLTQLTAGYNPREVQFAARLQF